MEILIGRASSLYGKLNDTLADNNTNDELYSKNNGILSSASMFKTDSEKTTGMLGLISKSQAALTIFGLSMNQTFLI